MNRSETSERVVSARRRWLLRLGAVLCGLAPFVLLEVGLRVGGMGETDWGADPFAALGRVEPLFVLGEEGERYEVGETRRPWFEAEGFDAVKGEGEFRVFCVGGSTVQGRPYSTATAFGEWLELSLKAADESKDWNVINAGGVSYASYRLAPIVEEVLGYEPDLIVIYTGHNEFLEERTYGAVKVMPRWLSEPYSLATRLRTVRVVSDWMEGGEVVWPEDRAVLGSDVEAVLDEYGGLEEYRREPEWRAGVIEHFGMNLLRMVRMAQERGVEVVLVNPVASLRRTAPFKSQHGEGLSEADEERYVALLIEGQERMEAEDAEGALGEFEAAVAIDGEYALGKYLLARSLDALGRMEEAKGLYVEANELDVCPLRAVVEIQNHVKEVAKVTGVKLVDVVEVFGEVAADGLAGEGLLIDHVHPTIVGHQLIAHHLALAMLEMGLIYPDLKWETRRDEAFESHLEGLGDEYHKAAEGRLLKLELWARGRASLKRVKELEGK